MRIHRSTIQAIRGHSNPPATKKKADPNPIALMSSRKWVRSSNCCLAKETAASVAQTGPDVSPCCYGSSAKKEDPGWVLGRFLTFREEVRRPARDDKERMP